MNRVKVNNGKGRCSLVSCYPLDDSPIKKRFHLLLALTLLQWQWWQRSRHWKKFAHCITSLLLLLLAAFYLISFNELPTATVCLPSFLLFGVLSKRSTKSTTLPALYLLIEWMMSSCSFWEKRKRMPLTRQISDGGKKLCVCDVHDQQHSQKIMTPAPLMTTFWPLTATIIR